jgi:NNP family nitrate/nitrite transporter-like MFS transporter
MISTTPSTKGADRVHAAEIAFVGPVSGSLARIYGARLADRLSGRRVAPDVRGGMIPRAGLLVASAPSTIAVQIPRPPR